MSFFYINSIRALIIEDSRITDLKVSMIKVIKAIKESVTNMKKRKYTTQKDWQIKKKNLEINQWK